MDRLPHRLSHSIPGWGDFGPPGHLPSNERNQTVNDLVTPELPSNAPYHQCDGPTADALKAAAEAFIESYRKDRPYQRAGVHLTWEWIWSEYDDGEPEDYAQLLGITVGIMSFSGKWNDYFTLLLPTTH